MVTFNSRSREIQFVGLGLRTGDPKMKWKVGERWVKGFVERNYVKSDSGRRQRVESVIDRRMEPWRQLETSADAEFPQAGLVPCRHGLRLVRFHVKCFFFLFIALLILCLFSIFKWHSRMSPYARQTFRKIFVYEYLTTHSGLGN
jgi:hypothetical protein